MNIPLKALIVEDVVSDAELLLRHIEKDGFSVISRRVETELDLEDALAKENWDVIFSDCSLPAFSAQGTLKLVKKLHIDIPVIIISGTIGEENAIELMRGGARDIVFKSKMFRLGQILRRELEYSLIRRKEDKYFKELKISESKYKDLFEAARDGILMLDAETGRIIDVNPYFTEVLGYAKDELIGKEIWEIGPFKDVLASQISFKELQSKEYIRYDDLPLETKNGKKKEYEFISNVYLEAGRKIIQCNMRDNSDRKAAEVLRAKLLQQEQQQLLQQEQQLKVFNKQLNSIINAIGDPFFIKDENSVFLFANDSLCDILGIDRKDIIGKTLGEALPDDQMQVFLENDKNVIKSGLENISEEKLTGKNGMMLDIVTSKTRYINDEGSRFLVGVIHDITEHKKLVNQLLQSQKMESLGTLAGGIAHDFNNLLTVIKGNIFLAKNKMNVEKNAAVEYDEIEKAADRAAELTKGMLLFSRQQPENVTNLDINEIVLDVMKMVRRIIGEDIKIKTDLQAGLWNIVSDKAKKEQVIMNIAINARDAMRQGGILDIKTENVTIAEYVLDNKDSYPGRFVKLSIQDNGCGMSKDIMDHMFEPFYTTKGIGKGTGLGLSVVYGIVKQANGWISVNSEQGKGSTLNVYLPASPAAKTAQKEKEIEVLDLKGKGERILIVEDETGIRKLLQSLLSGNGYTVFPSGSASEALEVFNREKQHFDIVFSDIVLPGRNGLELVKELLSVKPGLKVILSSGYMDEKSQSEIIHNSGYVFIRKPYELKVLLSVVKKVLSK